MLSRPVTVALYGVGLFWSISLGAKIAQLTFGRQSGDEGILLEIEADHPVISTL